MRGVTKEQRKQFFDRVAAAKGFDPLKPENWLLVSEKDIQSHSVFIYIIYLLSLNNSKNVINFRWE